MAASSQAVLLAASPHPSVVLDCCCAIGPCTSSSTDPSWAPQLSSSIPVQSSLQSRNRSKGSRLRHLPLRLICTRQLVYSVKPSGQKRNENERRKPHHSHQAKLRGIPWRSIYEVPRYWVCSIACGMASSTSFIPGYCLGCLFLPASEFSHSIITTGDVLNRDQTPHAEIGQVSYGFETYHKEGPRIFRMKNPYTLTSSQLCTVAIIVHPR
ncbi:hypothetical protein BGZ63DRAFT_75444 [Mariannaea sp. PMI_226]|nr:hypothetical protein BGZ63DRAFT_75444 [Mariannaea sp. PMI_226]